MEWLGLTRSQIDKDQKQLEKILVLLTRIEFERVKTLYGYYGHRYDKGERKIKKMVNKVIKLGGNPNAIIEIKDPAEIQSSTDV